MFGLVANALALACLIAVRNGRVVAAFKARRLEDERRQAAGLAPRRRRRRRHPSRLRNGKRRPDRHPEQAAGASLRQGPGASISSSRRRSGPARHDASAVALHDVPAHNKAPAESISRGFCEQIAVVM